MQKVLTQDEFIRQEAELSCIMDMGELLLIAGAEIMRVEDTMTRLCTAYGFTDTDVLSITSSIIVTVHTASGRVLTQTRRILARDVDLGMIERVNALSRKICAEPLPPEAFRRAIEEVKHGRQYSERTIFGAFVLVSASFAVFFGGELRDALAAALASVVLFFALRFGKKLELNNILLNFICSVVTALAISALTRLGLGQNPDMISMGNIMILIPGLAFTTSQRDMIIGDTISGLLGIFEAVLKTLAIAAGFASVLIGFGG